MKKIISIITIIVSSFLIMNKVDAASLSISASNSNPSVGSTVVISVKASDLIGQFSVTSSDGNVISGGTSSTWIENSTQTFAFSAKSAGSATVTVNALDVSDESGNAFSGSKSVTINVKAGGGTSNSSGSSSSSKQNKTLSTDNTLSSLSVNGYELSPAFDKTITEYSVELPAETNSIEVSAKVTDSNATISGDGMREVTDGDNNIEIVVTAEDGSQKKYTIKATVKELDPIKIIIDGKEYTVVRKKSMLTELNGYTETTVKINGEEVPALKSKVTGYTLVALKDAKGNQNYYIKKKDTYTLYKEYTFNKVVLYPLEWNKKDIPKNYKKTKITYNDDEIEVYKLKESSKYALIYGMNVETGEKHIYQYDSQEDTIQIYNDEELKIVKKENALILKIALGLGILSGVLAIVLIVTYINNNKRKKIKIKKVK